MADSPDWRLAAAALRADLRALSASLEHIREDVDDMRDHLAVVPLYGARTSELERDVEGIKKTQTTDTMNIDRLFTGLKIAGVVAAAGLTLAMVLTPYLIRASIHETLGEINRASFQAKP